MMIKKRLWGYALLASLAVMASCSDKDNDSSDDNEKGGNGGNDDAPTWDISGEWASGAERRYIDDPNTMADARTQQKQLEATAIAVAKHHKATSYGSLTDLAHYVYDTYLDDKRFNTDPIEDYFEDIWDNIGVANTNPATDRESYRGYDDEEPSWSWGNTFYEYADRDGNIYYEKNGSRYEEILDRRLIKLYRALDFSGHFYPGYKKWMVEDGKFDDVQFTFEDKDGKKCVLKAKASGSEKTVFVGEDKDWHNYSWGKVFVEKDTVIEIEEWDHNIKEYVYTKKKISGYYEYVDTDYYDLNDIKVSIPEKVQVTLTQDGETIVSSEVCFNLEGLEGEYIDLSKNRLTYKVNTKVGPSQFMIDKFHFKSGEKSGLDNFVLLKDGKKVMTANASFEADIRQTLKKYKDLDDAIESIADDIEDRRKISGVEATANILNEVQVKVVTENGKKIIDLMDEARDYDENESKYKAVIDEVNKQFTAGIFYYGGNTAQASVKLEAFEDRWTEWKYEYSEEYGYERIPIPRVEWYCEPVIVFKGGESLSMGEYFNEDDFRRLIDLIEDMGEEWEDAVDF